MTTQLINATTVYFSFLAEAKDELPKGIDKYKRCFERPGQVEYNVTGEYILNRQIPLKASAIEGALKQDGFKNIEW